MVGTQKLQKKQHMVHFYAIIHLLAMSTMDFQYKTSANLDTYNEHKSYLHAVEQKG